MNNRCVEVCIVARACNFLLRPTLSNEFYWAEPQQALLMDILVFLEVQVFVLRRKQNQKSFTEQLEHATYSGSKMELRGLCVRC